MTELYPEPERLAGESKQAYEAFRMYIDLGSSRSYREAARRPHKSFTLVSRWGSRWRWQDRLFDLDNERSRRALAEEVEKIRERTRRNQRMGLLARSPIARRLVSDDDGVSPLIDVGSLSWPDVHDLNEAAWTLERHAGTYPASVEFGVLRQRVIDIATGAGADPEIAAATIDEVVAQERSERAFRYQARGWGRRRRAAISGPEQGSDVV